MKKKKTTWNNSLFFLLGALIYSFFYWITDRNFVHVFGMILILLACYILYTIECIDRPLVKWVKTESIICMCAGVVFDSLSSGFPFGFLH